MKMDGPTWGFSKDDVALVSGQLSLTIQPTYGLHFLLWALDMGGS